MPGSTRGQCDEATGARAGFRVGGTPFGRGGGGPGWRIPAPRTGAGAPAGPPAASPSPARAALNDRDRELVRHLAAGRSTTQIAAAMSVSGNTARTRIRRVADKLDVRGRREVVTTARMLGIA